MGEFFGTVILLAVILGVVWWAASVTVDVRQARQDVATMRSQIRRLESMCRRRRQEEDDG